MLTKNRVGRARTIALTVVAVSGLMGMTLQPVLARTPDVARPAAAALAELELSGLLDQLREWIANLQALIDELEKALDTAPPPAEEDDHDLDVDVDDDDVDSLDESKDEDSEDVSLDEPEDVSLDEPEDESGDDES